MAKNYALITGASAGLGAEFARQLADRGHNLVLVARREDRLRELADDLVTACKVEVEIIAADLSEPSAPEMIEAQCRERGLDIDWLINNAGVAGPDLLLDREWSEQASFFQLMMTSVAALCHLMLPAMLERGYGRVINVASVAGRIPRSGGCNYGPSKAYLVSLSEELNLTTAARGVHVCALCPGFTHTDFHETAGLSAMKVGMPRWLWYTADVVVKDGIEGVERGKPVMISGRLYRYLDPLFQSVLTRRFFRIKARPDSE